MLGKIAIRFLITFTIVQAIQMDLPLFSAQIHTQSEGNMPVSTLSLQFNSNESYSDLSDCWTISLLNHLIAKRVFLIEADPSFDFSNGLANLETQVPMNVLLAALPDVVAQIEELENTPFTEYELEHVKVAAYDFLEQFRNDVAVCQEETELGLSSSLEFFDESVQCLENVNIANINEVVAMLHPYDSYHISYTAPSEVHAQPAESLVQFHNAMYQECQECSSDPFFTLDTVDAEEVAIRQVSLDEPSSDDLFRSLPVQDWEVDTIRKIVNTMGEKNLVQLLMKKKEMKKMGKKINHVHPLRFLEVIFSNSKTAHSMHEVRKSSFKWDAFIDGLSEKINEEYLHNNLVPYLHGFCNTLNVDYDEVLNIVSRREWRQFVEYLIRVS